jgi:hypothetical protein
MKKVFTVLRLLFIVMFIGCAPNFTTKIGFPPSDKLFVTMGDDPGSESPKPYIPKGMLIHVSSQWHLPIPILGLIPFGSTTNPQFVFAKKVIPQVIGMGGDALIGTHISYDPPSPAFLGFFGLGGTSTIFIYGQVVKR